MAVQGWRTPEREKAQQDAALAFYKARIACIRAEATTNAAKREEEAARKLLAEAEEAFAKAGRILIDGREDKQVSIASEYLIDKTLVNNYAGNCTFRPLTEIKY